MSGRVDCTLQPSRILPKLSNEIFNTIPGPYGVLCRHAAGGWRYLRRTCCLKIYFGTLEGDLDAVSGHCLNSISDLGLIVSVMENFLVALKWIAVTVNFCVFVINVRMALVKCLEIKFTHILDERRLSLRADLFLERERDKQWKELNK